MKTKIKLLLLVSFIFQGNFWRLAKGSRDSHPVEMTSSASTFTDVRASHPVEVSSVVSGRPPRQPHGGAAAVVRRRCEYKMSECVVKGHVFLNHYVKRIRKDKEATKCSRYLSFRKCFVSLLRDECRHLEPKYAAWRPIVEQMNCVCNKSEECLEDQRCFFREFYGYWSSRCNDFYRFNLRQRTRDQCHFLEENIRCREAVVSSGCGERASRFTTSYLEITTGRETKCSRNSDHNYTVAFRYTDRCTSSFLDQIDRCTTKCLTSKTIAKFHRENDVIVTGSRNSLKAACRSFQKYRKCLRPLEESCPQGVEKVIEYGMDLRKYWIKMNFICQSEVFNVYRSHLQCYQKVMRREFLKQCDVIWNDLTPWIENVTSYQFYCQSNHINTRNLVNQLDRLVRCHGAVFESQCGPNASSVMIRLLQTVFADPVYLRLDYRPDCLLHAPPKTTVGPTTTTTTSASTTTTTAASWHSFTVDESVMQLPLSFGVTMWESLRWSDPKADHRRTDLAGVEFAATNRSQRTGVYVALALSVLMTFRLWFG